MPHKHKRREQDASQFNLPPSEIAKALPVRNPQSKAQNEKNPKSKQPQDDKKRNAGAVENSRRKRAKEDDTPRAFRHLMQFRTTGRRAPSGLETGERKKKPDNNKRKRDNSDSKEESNKKPAKSLSEQKESEGKDAKQAMPKILPGEKLSDFAARVDRALPLSAMTKSAPGAPKDRSHKMTKHEKHLRRLQAGWREDEAKIRAKEQEEKEEREEEMEEQIELMKQWDLERRGGKAKKKGAVPKKKGGDIDDDPDPWAKLKKRDKERQANPLEVAQAPPELKKPREIFKVRGGAKVDVANVPNAVGSLRRREELADERRNIVEEYRRMMAAKRQ